MHITSMRTRMHAQPYGDGSTTSSKDDEILRVLNCSIPMSKQSPWFNIIQKTKTCGHLFSHVRRVRKDGFHYGRRFLDCPEEWVDKEWKGRARTMIDKVAEENLLVPKSNMEKDK
ncbi:hypothetical protein ZWY2020_014879 [Hordeum vulgare]|nr:hypothetical protein ZWY2020_014879 [Hordeum vulgare]